ncbi:MAG: ribose-phosphate pyrophosphokinase [Planctomycetes bacterium]|nr:ribose-phosphate pyrophosphokinase [Planctomycetota bacterium]MCB9916894.1 ribose-phosphate pyrophosphokinase [Planctomycetota bacterium]
MSFSRLRVFAGNAHRELAREICDELVIDLGEALVGRFPDGEIDLKVGCDVRGADCFVVQPTCPPVNENLVELCVMIDCLRRASADRITAVVPYFGYARKDRKDEGRVPITAKLVANMITTAGADRVLTVDLHAAQIQGFFDIPVDHLYARPAFLGPLRQLPAGDIVIVSPDVGGVKLCRAYSKDLEASLAIVDKRRVSGSETKVENLVGDVRGKTALVVDDLISTGGSITDAARVVKDNGAESVYLLATHGVLCGPAIERIDEAPIERIFLSNSIPMPEDRAPKRLEVVSLAPMLAKAIDSIHRSESVSRLFERPTRH